MTEVVQTIAKAIKERKWLMIRYHNRSGEFTSYWCAVHDISLTDQSFTVAAFNQSKLHQDNGGLLTHVRIKVERIQSACIINHTTYDQPDSLIDTIERNFDKLQWLQYIHVNDVVLDYLLDSMIHDSIPYQKETALIPGIDEFSLENARSNGSFQLSLKQMGELTEKLARLARNDIKKNNKSVSLAINLLSIVTKQGLFTVAYRDVLYDPARRSLIIDLSIKFNYEFASDETRNHRYNLKNYLDVETDYFTSLFINDPEKAKSILQEALPPFRESLDDRPYLMDLIRSFHGFIRQEFLAIKETKKLGGLPVSMLAFFGEIDSRMLSRRNRRAELILLNDKLNIDQLRVIHNALKQPVTYVQGPPGTGKTQCILNVLVTALFNKQKVLVTSNNNKPIDEIYEKIMNIQSMSQAIPLPVLRLGNAERVLQTLNHINYLLNKYDHYQADDTKLEKHYTSNQLKMKQINAIIDDYERRLEIEEEIDALISMTDDVKVNLRASVLIDQELKKKQQQLSKITHYDESAIHNLIPKMDYALLSWLFFMSIKHIKAIKKDRFTNLRKILAITDEEQKVKEFNDFTANPEHFALIQELFPIILTTNQSVHRLGMPAQKFDLAIIDEAGQSSIGYSLFAFMRAKRLLLVGDENQLRPVISLNPLTNDVLMRKYKIAGAYNYVENSILMTMQKQDTISKFVLLRYHYRCHPDIIAFSNKKYYHSRLISVRKPVLQEKALFYMDVDASNIPRSNQRNTSQLEAQAIISDIKKRTNDSSIAIITPFKNQSDLLKELIATQGISNVDVGTVHAFQGDEKDIVYLSTAIHDKSSDGSFQWLKNNQELINVATTRAKNKLIVVADYNEIGHRSPTSNDYKELIDYVKNNGKEVQLTPSERLEYVNNSNYKQYNTVKEKEFFETIRHLLSIGSKYKVQRQVKVADILNVFTAPKLHNYGMMSVFDLVVFEKIGGDDRPVLVIEVDGDEHSTDQTVIKRDALKEKICKDNGIQLIRIRNDYSRRYMHIKEIFVRLLR